MEYDYFFENVIDYDQFLLKNSGSSCGGGGCAIDPPKNEKQNNDFIL